MNTLQFVLLPYDMPLWNLDVHCTVKNSQPLDPMRDRNSSAATETWPRAGRPGLNSRQGKWWGFSLFATAPRPAPGPTQPLIQGAPRTPTPGTKPSTHLHPVPRPRRHGATPLLPQYVPTAWRPARNRNLIFPFQYHGFKIPPL